MATKKEQVQKKPAKRGRRIKPDPFVPPWKARPKPPALETTGPLPPPPDEDEQPTRQQIADHLFLTYQYTTNLISRGNLPKVGSLDDYRKVYIHHLRRSKIEGNPDSADGSAPMNTGVINPRLERARLQKAQADKATFDALVQQGKVLPREFVVQAYTTLMVNISTKMRGLGSKLCARVRIKETDAEAAALIDKEVDTMLLELAEMPLPEDTVGADEIAAAMEAEAEDAEVKEHASDES